MTEQTGVADASGDWREEQDSMGTLQVPAAALYGAQTQRAVNNFPISDLRMPRAMIRALGLIKQAAARSNQRLGLLDAASADAIVAAAAQVAGGELDEHFPIDVFQTGSGTSSNMNANEVIAHVAAAAGTEVHPNDDVNMSQSSNDVIPTAIQVAGCLLAHEQLLPALAHLQHTLERRAGELDQVAKTGRTHLMDAMPVTFGQELACWASQIASNRARIESALHRLAALPQGGTAVGTGINAHSKFAATFATEISRLSGFNFRRASNSFEGISSQDAAVELSGQLKTLACSLMKISNDLRWMNSGPLAGLGEIELKALQPGSSIMPGKVNPVIPEAVCMVCAQVIGNDASITVAGQAGNFQLNVMLPVVAYNLTQSLTLLANASRVLADSAIADFSVREDNVQQALGRNPILVTALNPVLGYELGAKIAKQAYQQNRPVKEVALELSDLDSATLDRLLDPLTLTQGGIQG